MCLQFVFPLVTRLAAWLSLWLCRREESWKNAETLPATSPARSSAAAARGAAEAFLGGPGELAGGEPGRDS
jgi:hypothetical protein